MERVAPSRVNLFREAFAGFDAIGAPAALLRAQLSPMPGASSRGPVVVLPGLGANDLSTAPLRRFLNLAGFASEGWGLGFNRGGRGLIRELSELSERWTVDRTRPHAGEGDVPALCDVFIDRVKARTDELGEAVSLVGWSLGGYVARETARDLPDEVRSVVTLGAPAIGGPKHTSIAPLYRARNIDLDWIEEETEKRHDRPIMQPITAIYSERDGIVSSYAAIDEFSPNVRHVRVDASHFGMGLNPKVWRLVVDALTGDDAPGGEDG